MPWGLQIWPMVAPGVLPRLADMLEPAGPARRVVWGSVETVPETWRQSGSLTAC